MSAAVIQLFVDPDDEDVEDARADDDIDVAGLSFFSASEAMSAPIGDPVWDRFLRADDAATSRVWRIYARESNERGIPCATPVERKRTEFIAVTPRQPKEGTMAQEAPTKKRGEMLEKVVETYNKLHAKDGAAVTARNIFESLGESYAKSIANVSMTLRRAQKKGLIGKGAPKKPGPKPKANGHVHAPKKAQTNGHRVELGHGSGDDALLASLIARRDYHADKAGALTIAIEALGGARS